MNCPICGKSLFKVEQSPQSFLNKEQFETVKAGDYFCKSCSGDEAKHTKYKYFCAKDIKLKHRTTDTIQN